MNEGDDMPHNVINRSNLQLFVAQCRSEHERSH